MTDMPKRDITGECDGECRDRVHEGEMERQEDINASPHKSSESFKKTPWARSRNDQPGVFGGHV
jgi:hypothetical protein